MAEDFEASWLLAIEQRRDPLAIDFAGSWRGRGWQRRVRAKVR